MAKIALAGTHGGGKTTLARLLATTISHDMITEKARWAAQDLGFGRPSNVPSTQRPIYQWHGLIAQISAEDRNESFVSDRSTADYAAYWDLASHNHMKSIPLGRSAIEGAPGYLAGDDYSRLCERNMSRYDAIILVPKNSKGCEDDGGRFLHGVEFVDERIRHSLIHWNLMDRVYEVVSDTPESRLDEVMGFLRSRGVLA